DTLLVSAAEHLAKPTQPYDLSTKQNEILTAFEGIEKYFIHKISATVDKLADKYGISPTIACVQLRVVKLSTIVHNITAAYERPLSTTMDVI
ncbi:MAG: hypothetical protein ABIM24_02790, partial [Paraperlucidibaca sp.]